MDQHRLFALLRLVHDPTRAHHLDRRAAETELQALSRTDVALEWALHALNQPPASADLQALFFACTAIDEAVAYRWAQLSPPQQAAVRDCLWHCATEPGRPHFVRAKLAQSLAHVICLEWPAAWPTLQACLGDLRTAAAAVDLLGACLDHFLELSQATTYGMKGKVLSADMPLMKQRYYELQPAALVSLCSLLHSIQAALPSALSVAAGGRQQVAAAPLALAARALRALRQALADAVQLPERQGVSSPALVALLFDVVGAVAPLLDGGVAVAEEAAEAAAEAAAAALDCAAELQAKYYAAQQAQQMLGALIPRLQDMCGLLQRRWAWEARRRGGAASPASANEDRLLPAFVRLLVQFIGTQLSEVEGDPGLAAAVRSLVAQLLELSVARRSPSDLLLLLEVWHAVLTHLEGFESLLWDAGDDRDAAQQVAAASAAYKEPILAMCDVVLSTLCPINTAAAPPLFTFDTLSAEAGSGAAVDDMLAAVAAGGEGGREAEQREAEAQQAQQQEEEESEGAAAGARLAADSEAEAYARHAESFLGRAISTFGADRMGWLLRSFQAVAGECALACQRITAASAGAPGGQGSRAAAAILAEQLHVLRGLDICLRLLVRCSPSFPIRGAAEPPSQLVPADGQAASGSHAVQLIRALCQLAGLCLGAAKAMAAPAPPGTPAVAAPGGAAAWAALQAVHSRLYRTTGAFAATWLSQLVAGLVQGSVDAEAAPVCQELLHSVLSAASEALAAAAASPVAVGRDAAAAAADSLVSLSSVALSSALRPPAALLRALWGLPAVQGQLLPVARASLADPSLLPLRASRALWLSLSDLSLRSWPTQLPEGFNGSARTAAFAQATGPLVQVLQQAAAAGGGADAAAAVRVAAAAAAAVVHSFAGSNRALRGIVSGSLVAPALPAVVALLPATGGGGHGGGGRGRAAAALLQLLQAALDVLAAELGTDAVEQLLDTLVQVFSHQGMLDGDSCFESDLLMMQLVVSIMSQSSSTRRHQSLLMPAMRYCSGVWDRTLKPHASAGSDADPAHVRAAALTALLSMLRHRWRALVGGGGGGGAAAASQPSLAAAASAAAAQAREGGGAVGQHGEGLVVIHRVVQMLVTYFTAAAGTPAVLSAADVRLVLEELYDLQVAAKLYSQTLFAAARPPLAAALLSLLTSRLYGGAQEALADTLFGLACANWTDFHTRILPEFVEERLGAAGVGPAERSALLALWGSADLDAHSFDRCLLAFLNDAVYYERAAAHATR